MRTEFGFLKDLKNHFNLSRIGDDCAVISKDFEHDYLITSDLLVENVDFRLEWTTPNHIGYKALAVSISDVAAMAGNPCYSILSIGIPPDHWETGFLDDFYEGYLSLADENEVELIGGDISRTPDKIVVDSTVIGVVSKGKAVLRSGAKPGHGIYVTGSLGGSAGGLKLLESGVTENKSLSSWQKKLIETHLRPAVPVGGNLLGIASSMIDISDGLSSDLKHLCEASKVGARVYEERIPVRAELRSMFDRQEQLFEIALHGGEDFELLFTAAPDEVQTLSELTFNQIGEITEDPEVFEIVTNGRAVSLVPGGFKHF